MRYYLIRLLLQVSGAKIVHLEMVELIVVCAAIVPDNKEQKELFSDALLNIKTYPVTQFKANRSPSGICDLLGNVFEYTQSFSNPGYINSPIILKGFSWLRPSYEEKNDITAGHYSFTFQRWADVGFRCVKRIFRKEDAQRFIADGDKAKDWERRWWYDRARHIFDTLSSVYFSEPVDLLCLSLKML